MEADKVFPLVVAWLGILVSAWLAIQMMSILGVGDDVLFKFAGAVIALLGLSIAAVSLGVIWAVIRGRI
jgi:hypothetical protein